MENEAFVDGELESLLGMFNFDQCSSDDSSFYNVQHHHPSEMVNDLFPFATILQGNYPAVPNCSNHQRNLYIDSRQELVKPRKKLKLSPESNLVPEPPQTTWRDGQNLNSFNISDDEKALGLETNTSKSLKRKANPNKGIATDPQSLYARKRRDRINDRLKTLQRLVPNGTKVDVSTMLEQAVHYVKFLQLQIKLLSSDDLWMYAPLAHNGLNMGLHPNLFSRLM